MEGLTYTIPVIKGKTSSDEGRILDCVSQFPRNGVLKALFPKLTPEQIKDVEDFARDFEPVVFQPKPNVLTFETPDDNRFRTYLTEFNGGSPLRVEINPGGVVSVYKVPDDNHWTIGDMDEYPPEEYPERYYTELIKAYRPRKIFLGEKIDYKEVDFWPGNTILLELEPGKYARLWVEIEEFEVDDEILHYYSPVGPSAVPYPVAVGKKYVYDMSNLRYYPIKIYNEDVPEEYKFDFWHLLDRSKEGRPIKDVKRIRKKK